MPLAPFRFCKTGPNAGKPGPCPKGTGGAPAAPKPAPKAKPAAGGKPAVKAPAAKPAAKKAPAKPPKPTADSVHKDIAAVLGSGKRLDVRHVRKVAESLKTLTVAQIREVRAKLGVKGTTGPKAALAQAIAERAVAAVKAKAAPAKPAAKPTPAPKPPAPKPPAAKPKPAPKPAKPKAKPEAKPAPPVPLAAPPTPKGEAKSKNGQPAGHDGNKDLPDHSRPKLTSRELDAVERYTSDEYAPLNAALRNTGRVANPDSDQIHAGLQSAFAKAEPFPAPVQVARGMRLLDPVRYREFVQTMQDAQKTGATVRIPGYTSTSTGGVGKPFEGNVELRIAATHGLDAMPYSVNQHERELLLNHNSGFRVDRIERGDKGKYIVHMTQIDGGVPATHREHAAAGPAAAATGSRFLDTDFAHWTVTPPAPPDPEALLLAALRAARRRGGRRRRGAGRHRRRPGPPPARPSHPATHG